MPESDLVPAATVVLIRNGLDGIEALMLKRNSKIAYGSMWVFPGGRVDPGDIINGDERASARRAAIREAKEEASLEVDPGGMVAWSYWIPPLNVESYIKTARRRFSTWFFLAEAPRSEIRVDMGEIHDHEWMSPLDAIARRDAGEIELVAPTWITLFQLSQYGTVAEALEHARGLADPPEFFTHPLLGDVITLTWVGDEAYPSDSPAPAGSRHRLILDPKGWVYQQDH